MRECCSAGFGCVFVGGKVGGCECHGSEAFALEVGVSGFAGGLQ
jgi:hypothetical protein